MSAAIGRPLGILAHGRAIASVSFPKPGGRGQEACMNAACRFSATQADSPLQASMRSAAAERERTQSISVHKGFKVQAAICVERPPLYVQEPEYKRRWRVFREAWEKRTNNHLKIDDDIVFMRYHFQFLEDPRAARSIGGSAPKAIAAGDGAGSADAMATAGDFSGGGSALDKLLSSEGLDLAFPKQGRKTVRRRKQERMLVEQVDDHDVRAIKRLGNRTLFLLVRYGQASKWTFPKADRAHGQPMRETLHRLCDRQFGENFAPYILGACPFAHRKRRSDQDLGIEGRKVFYYRARVVPGVNADLALEDGGPIADWAWCSREELPKYLDVNEWHCVREGLPLDSILV
eukprot:CAMPEP_0183434542 /NCGR_PEP_ID=MMETSP0370-20130417/63612_1 /TAXON_ID=268820 /ORGANISM="Peridinium aciculiferum, Strain PAER-2" /LENGTH=346 /DNA_ID=CAMNT_0025621249 /DNA_START=33 /DNA_END=1073 /DNA_ORIENTATION=+